MNKNKQELYSSPQVEVIEIQEQKVICQSTANLDPWNYNDNDL